VEWEKADVSLLPDGNTVNGIFPGPICGLGNKIFVMNQESESVSLIDLANENRVTNVPVGRGPHTTLYVVGNKIVVVNEGESSLSIIEPNDYSVMAVTVEESPTDTLVSGTKIFMKDYTSNNLFILDLANDNEVTTVGVGKGFIKGRAGNKVECGMERVTLFFCWM
jgi:YVTN family beta-propeller protein